MDGTCSDVPSVGGSDTLLCLVRVKSAECGSAITNDIFVILKSEKASSGDCACVIAEEVELSAFEGGSVFNFHTDSDTCHEDEYSTASLK